MNSFILAGDIGGTNLRLALYSIERGLLDPILKDKYITADHESLDDSLIRFLEPHRGGIDAACFGVAGPVSAGAVEMTNTRWNRITEENLCRTLKTKKVKLINDLTAMAYGVLALQALAPDRFVTLNPGNPGAVGNVAVIAAGTGLGEGYMFWDGQALHPSPSEGGHTDFAPTNDLEDELLLYLRSQFGHVSYERVVSGPALQTIYMFLRQKHNFQEPQWMRDEFAAAKDPNRAISKLGLSGESAICEQTLAVFLHIYGSEAGNMALKMWTTGGIYVGGTIALKLLDKITHSSDFMDGFLAKGRFRKKMETIPVRVINERECPLLGAAWEAWQLLEA